MKENKEFNSIMSGLSESLEYAKGNTSKARKVSISIAELPTFHDKEIKKIREDLNLTQKKLCFCSWGFSKNSRSLGIWSQYSTGNGSEIFTDTTIWR